MLRIIFPAGIAGTVAQLLGAETAPTNPFLTLAMALLGSSLVAAFMTAMARRRSGEDRAAAADSVGSGADAVAQGSTLLVAPLNARILELTRKNAELEGKLAQSRREEAERAIAMADMQTEMLRLQRDADERSKLDRAEVHEVSGKLAVAQVDLANALHEIDTLKVRLGEAGERRTDDRRTDDQP